MKKRMVAKVMGGSSFSPTLIAIQPIEKINIAAIIIVKVSLSIPEMCETSVNP
jgi:hypothetical protein